MPHLEFDCRFRYESGFALDLAFDVREQVTALVGPSGCGKTTVLNLIAGLLTPASGRIALDDVVLFDSQRGTNLPPERRLLGYVFQDYQLFPHLSVLGNLRYGQARTSDRGPPLEKVAATLELSPLLARRPRELSGGQQQRVAIGRAILRAPALLLLDEPLSALDEELRKNVTDYLSQVIDEFRIPTLLVSHDRGHAAALATGAVEIRKPQ